MGQGTSKLRRSLFALALATGAGGLLQPGVGTAAPDVHSDVPPAVAVRGLGDATLPAPGEAPTMQVGNRWFPRDDQGRAFVLHGYNIKLHGDRLDEVTPAELRNMRANGFTVLRLATFWADLEPTEGDWNETYISDLRRILQDAEDVGLKVALTMHQDSYSPTVGGYGMPDWTTRTDGLVYSGTAFVPCLDPANQRAWQHFWEDTDLQQFHVRAWEKIVTELGDEPALYGYDILNEPCGQMNPGEGLTEALQRVEATQITPMLQRVTNAIRALDATHWIFLEGAYANTSSLGGATALGHVDDPTGRQIYAPHIYDLGMESGSDWDPSSEFVQNYFDTIGDYGAANEIPTIVFEWGPQKPALPNAENYVHQVLHGADAAVAGWNAFAWVRGLSGWCQLDSNGNPGAGMTDTVQVYPVQVAGRPVSIDGNYAAGESTVTVDPIESGATGPTTFSFPLRRFPNGPEVNVEEARFEERGARAELPDDEWTWSFDEATQTVSVDVVSDLPYTIRVRQADEPPATTTTATSTTAPSSTVTATTVATSSSTTLGATTSTAPTSTTSAVAASGATNSNGTGGSLPRTGTEPFPLLLGALALLATGSGAVALGRRFRTS